MSISFNTIQTALYTWAHGQSGERTTIWYRPNAPRPSLPYISLSISEINAVGQDFETKPDVNGDVSLFGNREFVLEVNHYGPGGLDVMEKLRTSLQREDVRNTLGASGVYYVARLAQNNISTLLDTSFEDRVVLELRFRYSNQGITAPDTYNVGLIELMDIEGKVKNAEGDVVLEQDIRVPEHTHPVGE